MSTFRSHRVVIASLFLPETVVSGESVSPTPTRRFPTPAADELNKLSLGSNLNGSKSIVDDLKDKSRIPTPAIRSSGQELSNPFASLPLLRTKSISDSRRRHQSRSTSSRRSDPARTPLQDYWCLESNPHCNGGLKNAIDSVGPKLKQKLWVGTLGINTDSFPPSLRSSISTKLHSVISHPSLPVWVPDADFHGCYDEFCHQVLWPCLHYAIPDAPRTKTFYESASYSQYVAVNQCFADAIIAAHQDGDIIWVNDYHLMLLPALLRSSGKIPPTTPIGFFMHVAFPSSEIFRCLSVRHDLLRGLLGADLVGFQTANYARHFRATVSRIMAYEALPKGIQVADGDGAAGEDKVKAVDAPGKHARGRFVDVGVFPMGIDVWQLKEKKADPEVKEWILLLTQRYAGMKIVVGRDKLDEVQGVRHKIKAFEYFLDKHPEFQGKAILIQVALPTTSASGSPESLAVNDAISRINSRFSTLTYQPVVFLHTQDLTFSQYLALLSVADAFMVTSLREGMALRTHEFVECQEGRCRPLVLSEFTGSYSYSGFRSCIAINPWDTRGTAEAINQALTMDDDEAIARWEDLHNHVTTQTAQAFVNSFLTRCIRAHAEDLASGVDVPVFDVGRVFPRYRHSRRRLVLLDLEGTLWSRDLSRGGLAMMEEDYARDESGDEKWNGRIDVPEEVLNVLERLVEDRRNEVWLMSGLRMRGVLERISKRVSGLGIVAENGCFIKTIGKRSPLHRSLSSSSSSPPPSPLKTISVPSISFSQSSPPQGYTVVPAPVKVVANGPQIYDGNRDGWINMVSNFNLTWKAACLEILHYFTERTPGSFVEDRDASVVWRFWTGGSPPPINSTTEESLKSEGDRHWAWRQAAEAQNHIFDSLGERYGLRIIPGRNSFLVLPNNISRSTAVGAILHPGGPARSPLLRSWMSPDTFDGGIRMLVGDREAGGSGEYGGYGGYGGGREGEGGVEEFDFLLAISGDEKLLRRLNEFDCAETCSTKGRGTDAKWKLDAQGGKAAGEVVKVLVSLIGA